MKYDIKPTAAFKKDLRLMEKQNKDIGLIKAVITMLANGEALPKEYRDHSLTGNMKHYRECHIQPDWIMIYRYFENELILSLTRTGSHSDLLKI
ncbi:MAG: type II toxin-antitoxin system YafQ family toxin [Ruminiclostridium sp.]|nr:type II toxin-antitoxin system YafQ family toxin [Ruminiclostridium sp.]